MFVIIVIVIISLDRVYIKSQAAFQEAAGQIIQSMQAFSHLLSYIHSLIIHHLNINVAGWFGPMYSRMTINSQTILTKRSIAVMVGFSGLRRRLSSLAVARYCNANRYCFVICADWLDKMQPVSLLVRTSDARGRAQSFDQRATRRENKRANWPYSNPISLHFGLYRVSERPM